ncbi:RNA polymerase II-binding domain-containing protein [Massariosphaeria phaeospora]|uniref:RNA polymerase II-binding domain-containing protein n=1 Tax=Massariosphaeria phaeospora TaxID=100035 RepID=A0A7C8M2K2_9PLEO|nr:RNA polymerase II-binding domain-containing protein [Massariosphaeria phaeospora]
MAFTEDGLRAKLSSLNETQESITAVGQWVLFHSRRHAERITAVWVQRLREASPSKKLNLIYLANEVAQTSKIRKKDEFLRAFDPVMVEAITIAYKGSSPEVQNKIRRVVEVWRQRQVFKLPIQDGIERSINDLDRSRSSRKPTLGGSLFSSSATPPELASVAPLATSLQKADLNAKPAIADANQDYEKLTNPNNGIPSAPKHAAGLAALLKKLAVAEGAAAECVKARQALITGMENLLETNKLKLEAEKALAADITTRKNAIEGRRDEVEKAILSGLSATETQKISAAPLPVLSGARLSANAQDVTQERPQVEELTPPPMETFTPVGSPNLAAATAPDVPDLPDDDDVLPTPVANPVEPMAAAAPPGATALSAPATVIGAPNVTGLDTMGTFAHSRNDDGHATGVYSQSTYKKRKMSRSATEDEFAAFAGDGDMDGIDSNLSRLIEKNP